MTKGSTTRESAETFRLLVDAVKDYAIYMLDTEGYIVSWNPGAERAKQYTADDIIGQHFSTFYIPEEQKQGRPRLLLNKALADGRVEDEGWRVRKDGTRFWADVIVTAVYNDDGQHVGFAKVTRDMTERRNLVTAREDALRASQAKSAFLANMSHELRTPLNAIIGYAELIQDQLREKQIPELSEDVQRILFSSNHLLSIISDILDLSKVEAGELELRKEEVDVELLLQEVMATITPIAECNGNATRILQDKDVTTVSTDRTRLRQVLYNLLSNAAKFTQNGLITLAAARSQDHEDHIEFSVSDTGSGISEEQLHMIFKRFYQVESQQEHRKLGGTGLGLAISQMLCEALGGSISVKSTMGEGTVFSVLLPIHDYKYTARG